MCNANQNPDPTRRLIPGCGCRIWVKGILRAPVVIEPRVPLEFTDQLVGFPEGAQVLILCNGEDYHEISKQDLTNMDKLVRRCQRTLPSDDQGEGGPADSEYDEET